MRQSYNRDASQASGQRGRWHKADGSPNSEDRALQRFADMMIEKLEDMEKSNWQKPWFTDGIVGLPQNLDGRHYNASNSFLLLLEMQRAGYRLPVFATFDRISRLNAVKTREGWKPALGDDGQSLPHVGVNKGESCFPVFLTTFTVVDKDTKERISYDDYKRLTPEEQKQYEVYPHRRVYNVFNIEQTNIREARPELYNKILEAHQARPCEQGEARTFAFEPLDSMIEGQKWFCPIILKYQDRAFYSKLNDSITLPEKRQFAEAGDESKFYGTAFHEMAHSTGIEGRLGRDMDSSYGREELVAEMSAAVLCQKYGMVKYLKEEKGENEDKDDSLNYLKAWLGNLRQEPKYLNTVLSDVKKASDMIDTKIEEVVRSRESKLDIREDETQTVAVDETGDARLVDGESLGADRKQGDNEEGPDVEEVETEEHRQAGRRWHH